MEDYHFGADLLDAYRATADWVKAVGIVTSASFILGFCALLFRYRLSIYEAERRRALRSAGGAGPDPDLQARLRRVLGERQMDCRNKAGNDG